jgi:hypothetical protein
MRDILKTEELDIPDGVDVTIKSRLVTVKGPRGTLTKNLRHADVDIRVLKGKVNKVTLAVWQGGRKHVAVLRTLRSLINNLITGVTKVLVFEALAHSSTEPNGHDRASNTRCEQYTPISLSTALYKKTAVRLKFVISWARRFGLVCTVFLVRS